MVQEFIMRPPKSEKAPLVVKVLKEDRCFWFCADCRRLHSASAQKSYSRPQMDDFICSLDEAIIFDAMNANRPSFRIYQKMDHLNKQQFFQANSWTSVNTGKSRNIISLKIQFILILILLENSYMASCIKGNFFDRISHMQKLSLLS